MPAREGHMPQDWHAREEKLTRAFVELADTLVASFDVDEFLHMLCHHAEGVLEVDAVGVMLESIDGTLRLSTASTDDTASLDLFQIQEREGPCYDAYRTGEQVIELDLREAGSRWPSFSARALEAGLRAVYGFPMRWRSDVIGAMNLFRNTPGRFDDRDVSAAQALADMTTIGLVSHRRVESAETVIEQLQHALDSRTVIEQAKGLLAERAGVHTREAFERIRRYARDHRRPIRSVCADLLAGDLDIT